MKITNKSGAVIRLVNDNYKSVRKGSVVGKVNNTFFKCKPRKPSDYKWNPKYHAYEIELTSGYKALVDKEDIDIVKHFKWNADVNNKGVYASTCVYVNGKARALRLHNLITNTGFGCGRGNESLVCNHKLSDMKRGLDNRRSSIEVITHLQNRRYRADNTTGCPCVYKFDNGRSQGFTVAVKVSTKKGRETLTMRATKKSVSMAEKLKQASLYSEIARSYDEQGLVLPTLKDWSNLVRAEATMRMFLKDAGEATYQYGKSLGMSDGMLGANDDSFKVVA